MRSYLLTIFILFLALSSYAQNNYILFRPTEKKGIIRIYIDRAGNVYPSKDYVDSTKFPHVSRKDPEYANLRSYLLKYDLIAYKRVLNDNHVSDFGHLQEKLINDCAVRVNEQLKSCQKLVVLIHGFNEYAAPPFDSLEVEINKHLAAENITYLEVYWDGLKAYREVPADVFKIWFRANRTAPYAAMTLRKLFAKINNTDLYIITHSLGACVGTRLLFNTHEGRCFPFTKQWKALATPPQSNITLAMLAPAIAGPRVFRYLGNTVPAGNYHNYKRVVVGYDKYDVATTKQMRFPLSRLFYSTSLGCSPSVVRHVGRKLKSLSPATEYSITDFSKNVKGEKNKIHHIDKYINDTKHFDNFLDEIFAKGK